MNSTGHQSRVAAWVTFLALGAILAATLTSASTLVPPAGPWCIRCGDVATVDILQNILLYIPLGIGLALLGLSTVRVMSIGFALSTLIELLQFTVIPGRDGTVGDVVMNTLGAAVGAALVAWRVNPFAPTLTQARWLRALAPIAWTLIAMSGVYGFRPVTPDPPYSLVYPYPDSARSTTASVVHVWVDVEPVPLTRGDTLPVIRRALRPDRSSFAIDAATSGRDTDPQRIIRLASKSGAVFTIGQVGDTFTCARMVLASRLGLRTPALAVSAPVAAGTAWTATDADPLRLVCGRDPAGMTFSSTWGGRSERQTSRLTPGAGWTLYIPSRLPAGTSGFLWTNAVWLLVLGLGLGFCSVLPTLARAGSASPPFLVVAPRLVLPILLIVLSQTVAPRFAGTSPSPWWEIAASIAGLAVGAVAATRPVRFHHSGERRGACGLPR